MSYLNQDNNRKRALNYFNSNFVNHVHVIYLCDISIQAINTHKSMELVTQFIKFIQSECNEYK